ncbi:hypothetical protein ACROYT_G026416 [Oculina patagonica]
MVSCFANDVDECASDDANDCHPNALCNNTDGSYTCHCFSGYQGDGRNCSDIDECSSAETNECNANALCANTNGSYVCNCKKGYNGDGKNCSDTDECARSGTNECDPNALCNNTEGSYMCRCRSGYQGDGKNCTSNNTGCFPSCGTNAFCQEHGGPPVCVCNVSFQGDGYNCTDIDECKNDELNECHSNALCTNTEGSHICRCRSGYKGDGRSCTALQLEIQAFQPAVVPIRAITTLTLKTNGELNVTSNSSLQCRFKDISVPARMEDGFIFCDTPPMRNIDRVSVHLDVDGKLFKTKKPLYFHEPFKLTSLTPSVVSPAQNVHLTVSGISCEDWMQYYVRFQTANGTKKTQQGICKDSIVSCFVPEFPPNTRLRVGLTLSNRLVQWADTKIRIQYPVDAIRSSVSDVKADTSKKGAFTFLAVLRDRFKNFIRAIEKDNKKHTKISVQYSPQDKPQSMKFLECSTTVKSNVAGDAYMLSCTGAEKEHIFFYPSINNVPLGGQDRYEVTTTLCPGKSSCEVKPKSFPLVLVLGCGGVALLVLLAVVLLFVRRRYGRYQVKKKQRATTNELEIEVQLLEHHLIEDPSENAVLDATEEEGLLASLTQENAVESTELTEDTLELHSCVSCLIEGSAQGHQTDAPEEQGTLSQKISGRENENGDEVNHEEIEMTAVKEEEGGIAMLLSRLQSSADKFTTLVAGAQAENCSEKENKNNPKKLMLILIKEMNRAIQEIEQLRQQQDEEPVTQRTKGILKAFRLAIDHKESNSGGNWKPLPSIEELQKNLTDLGKVMTKNVLTPPNHNDTAV